MTTRLGTILREARGAQSRADFAKRIGLSYTYVRSLELGRRLPSDGVLAGIAGKLGLDVGKVILAAYCDRSSALNQLLTSKGVVDDFRSEEAGDPSRTNSLSLYFDADEFSAEEVAEFLIRLSSLYQEVGGDRLVIDTLGSFSPSGVDSVPPDLPQPVSPVEHHVSSLAS